MKNPDDQLEPILLLGGTGMLGRAWRRLLESTRMAFHAPDRDACDLCRPVTLRQTLAAEYRTVVNCAGWTDVDGAENDPDAALACNGNGVRSLADCCARVGATLLHYSTDYVFPGDTGRPCLPQDQRDPVNIYGWSKALGEEEIERSGVDHLIVRTSWLYAPWGSNFVLTMQQLMQERPTLKVVDDQTGTPTSSTHLAAASLSLLNAGSRGVAHVTDGGQCTWYEFAAQIARQLSSPCVIEPCTSAAFPRPALRPTYSVLDVAATERVLGPMPSWQTSLCAMMTPKETVLS